MKLIERTTHLNRTSFCYQHHFLDIEQLCPPTSRMQFCWRFCAAQYLIIIVYA